MLRKPCAILRQGIRPLLIMGLASQCDGENRSVKRIARAEG
jgi:hypothetical protein